MTYLLISSEALLVANFDADIERGLKGEERVRRFLLSIGYSVEKYGFNGAGWSHTGAIGDLGAPDFLVTGHPTETKVLIGKTLEVKTDYRSHETGRVAMEIYSNMGSGRQGWVWTTKADFIAYLSALDGELCIFPVPAMRTAMKELWHRMDLRPVKNQMFTAACILVPMKSVRNISIWTGNIE